MYKFVIYRNLTIACILLSVLSNLISYQPSQIILNIRTVSAIIMSLLYFVCFGLLGSIFNFYKEPGWKNLTLFIYITGNIMYNFLFYRTALKPGDNISIAIFYLPVIISFISMNVPKIKSLTSSFGYILLLLCGVKIAIPFLRNIIDMSDYVYFFNAFFLVPPIFMALLYHRMINASSLRNNENNIDLITQDDLL